MTETVYKALSGVYLRESQIVTIGVTSYFRAAAPAPSVEPARYIGQVIAKDVTGSSHVILYKEFNPSMFADGLDVNDQIRTEMLTFIDERFHMVDFTKESA